jgi:hypothetical protein
MRPDPPLSLPEAQARGVTQIRLVCPKCGRRGSYAIGRHRERLGDASMIEVRQTLSADCHRRGSSNRPIIVGPCLSGEINSAQTPPRAAGPSPTLGPKWLWLYCQASGCFHRAPAAIAPFVIRWGAEASSDTPRRSARCSACGVGGATTMLPRWGGSDVGWRPFPAVLRP